MTNINKFGVGQLKSVKLPNGREVFREELLQFIENGQITVKPQLPDDDHFLYQAHKIYTEMEVIMNFNGKLPEAFQGPAVMCTCGADGIYFTEGPLKDKAVCRHFALFQRHQTSEKIVNRELILSKESKKWLDDNTQVDFEQNKIIVPRKY